jgi:RNA polymerase sigma factor (sigma-70 family)
MISLSAPSESHVDDSGTVAWDQIYQTYYPCLLRYARRGGASASDAEDIAAEVLKKFYIQVTQRQLPLVGSFHGYLVAMVRNAVIDHRHANRAFYGNGCGMLCAIARTEIQIPQTPYTETGNLSDVEVRQKMEILAEAMTQVRSRVVAKSWQIFWAVTAEEIPAQDVARQFNVRVQTVYQRNFQIRRMLRVECGFTAE